MPSYDAPGSARQNETARRETNPGNKLADSARRFPRERNRPRWARRSSRMETTGYLFVRHDCDACRHLLADLAAREARWTDRRPVGVVDVRWLRRDNDPSTAVATPALAIFRGGREIARAVGVNAVLGFTDALFSLPAPGSNDEDENED